MTAFVINVSITLIKMKPLGTLQNIADKWNGNILWSDDGFS